MSKHIYICQSPTGLVVPTPEGGTQTLKLGDEVEGEYYEQVAARVPSLVLKSSLPKEAVERLAKAKAARSGATFPEEFRALMAGETKKHDPQVDRVRRDTKENFQQALREAQGEDGLKK